MIGRVVGVLKAADDESRARRGEILATARRADPYPLDEAVMCRWAEIVRDCRAAGVHRMVELPDSLIAATAVARRLPVVTQDGDYDAIAGAHPALRVARVRSVGVRPPPAVPAVPAVPA